MKHLEHIPSTGDSDIYGAEESLQHELLDLLVDGPSSFAALYGGLVRHCGYPTTLELPRIINALLEMEQRGWVKASQMAEDGSFHEPTEDERRSDLLAYQAWLPDAAFEDLSLDEVGLWYEITTEGRAEWKQWSPDAEGQSRPRWMLDDLSDTQTIRVQAKTIEAAEEGLRWWLSHNQGIDLVSNGKTVEPVSVFTLHDGTVITNGVELVYQYRKQNGSS